MRAYALSQFVLAQFLGWEWIRSRIHSSTDPTDYLRALAPQGSEGQQHSGCYTALEGLQVWTGVRPQDGRRIIEAMASIWASLMWTFFARSSRQVSASIDRTLRAGVLVLVGACHEPPSGSKEVTIRDRWSQSQSSGSKARPLVANDIVYFGTGAGEIIARDFETGAARWSTGVALQSEIAGANLLMRSGVLVAAGIWEVGGIDASTGARRWAFTTPLDTVDAGSAPAPGMLTLTHLDADDQKVYVPAWGASVSAVDLQTGLASWIWQPGRSVTDTAANMFRSGAAGARVSGDTVFVTAWHWLDRLGLKSENWLVVLDRATGRELLRITVPSFTGGVSVFGAPAIHQNHVIFASRGGHVWAIDRTTWQVAWHFNANPQFLTSTQAEVYGDSVYFDGGDESLYAINAKDGSLAWKASAGGATRDLLVTDARVYCPTQGLLKIFDRRTGAFVVEASVKTVNDIFETPPAFARSRIFVGTTPAALSFDEP